MVFKEIKPKDDDAWLKLRRSVLTASDLGIILGLNKWASVKEMQESKINPTFTGNAYTELGQLLEPVVVETVNKVLSRKFKLFENGSRSFFVDKHLKFGATPDAGDETELLECKTTKPGNYLRYSHWPPAYYLAQLYAQLIATERQVGYLAILSTNMTQNSFEFKWPLAIFKLERTEELDELVFSEVKRYWDTVEDHKQYRVNRKESLKREILFRCQTRKIK